MRARYHLTVEGKRRERRLFVFLAAPATAWLAFLMWSFGLAPTIKEETR